LFPDGSLALSVKIQKITREDQKDKKSLTKAELPKQKNTLTIIRTLMLALPSLHCDNLPHPKTDLLVLHCGKTRATM
jgi:hypothetical protein